MRKIAFWLSLCFIFIVPWEDMIVIPAFVSLGRFIGLAAAGYWVFITLYQGRLRQLTPFHVVMIIFVFWNVSSIYWTANFASTLSRAQTYLQLLVLNIMLWDIYDSQTRLKAALQIYILGTFVAIGNITSNYLNGVEFSPDRYSVSGANPDEVGLVMVMGLPVAWYLITSVIHSKSKNNYLAKLLLILNITFIPAAIFGAVLTGTRTALIASLPGFIYILISLNRLQLPVRILIFVALAISLYFLQPLFPKASLDRLASTGNELAEGDLSGRTKIWGEGLAAFSDQPILGTGSSTFRTVNSVGKVAHNAFLSVLVEVGLVGFLLFCFILLLVVDQIFRLPKDQFLFWMTLFIIWLIGASVLTWEHKKQTWLFLSLAIANGKTIVHASGKVASQLSSARPTAIQINRPYPERNKETTT